MSCRAEVEKICLLEAPRRGALSSLGLCTGTANPTGMRVGFDTGPGPGHDPRTRVPARPVMYAWV